MQTPRPDLAEVLAHESTDKRIDILRRISACGSISEAARSAGVSYKAAWQAIETLGNLAGTPMVEKAVGGSGGGGAALTAAGRRVLEAAALLDRARRAVLGGLASADAGEAGVSGLAAMALRTSMRNQFPCRVASLRPTSGFVRVGLTLSSGGLLHARITRESVQLLQLAKGLSVLALCKATAVRVAPLIDAAASRNVLVGTVQRAARPSRSAQAAQSAIGGEVTLQVEGGVSLVGFADAGQGFTVGQRAMASVEEAAVVVAVAG